MDSPENRTYLAKVLYTDSNKVIAEFNRHLHLPLPAFGTLIKIDCKKNWIFGLIADARLKGESQANNSDFFKLPVPLDTEIHIIPVGYISKENKFSPPVHEIPQEIPSAGQYVFMPNENELQLFTIELGFLKTLLKQPSQAIESLIITAIRKFSTIYPDPQSYLIRVTQELSRIATRDRSIVQRIVNRTLMNSYSTNTPDERFSR